MIIKPLCDLAKVAKGVQFHVLHLGDDNFQVVIQPSLALSEKYPALAQPLLVTESSEKLEAEVHKALTAFTPMIEQACNNLEQVQSNLDAAVKDAAAKGSKKASNTSTPKVVQKTGTTTTDGVKPTSPMVKQGDAAPDLFSSTPAEGSGGSNTANTPVAPAEPEGQQGGDVGVSTDADEDSLPNLPM